MIAPMNTSAAQLRIALAAQLAPTLPTLPALYAVVDQLAQDAFDTHPEIACPTGCNTCCHQASMPAVTGTEFALLYTWMQSEWTLAQWRALETHLVTLYTAHKTRFWAMHAQLNQPFDPPSLARLIRDIQPLEGTPCVLLQADGRCGVYPVRPSKCRAHGGFAFDMNGQRHPQACRSEVERWHSSDADLLTLPLWNPFEQRLQRHLRFESDTVTSILPLWLWAHRTGDGWGERALLAPDFNTLERSF